MGSAEGRAEPAEARGGFCRYAGGFRDPARVVARDIAHGGGEERFYCFGRTGEGVLTARSTYRGKVIRIIGAGYWRRGKKVYEAHSKVS